MGKKRIAASSGRNLHTPDQNSETPENFLYELAAASVKRPLCRSCTKRWISVPGGLQTH